MPLLSRQNKTKVGLKVVCHLGWMEKPSRQNKTKVGLKGRAAIRHSGCIEASQNKTKVGLKGLTHPRQSVSQTLSE